MYIIIYLQEFLLNNLKVIYGQIIIKFQYFLPIFAGGSFFFFAGGRFLFSQADRTSQRPPRLRRSVIFTVVGLQADCRPACEDPFRPLVIMLFLVMICHGVMGVQLINSPCLRRIFTLFDVPVIFHDITNRHIYHSLQNI